MPRPKKATVEYFPHTTSHGKTLFVIESRWGNDGYAAWFKILEQLGLQEGHSIDCRDEAAWSYLVAYTRVDEDTLLNILDALSKLGAIDSELWSHRVVFCQHFIDGVQPAYRMRKDKAPTREMVLQSKNIHTTGFPSQETPLCEEGCEGSTERRGEEIIGEKPTTTKPESVRTDSETPEPDQKSAAADERHMPVSECRALVRKYLGQLMDSPAQVTVLQDICHEYPPERIVEAFQAAAASKVGARGGLNWVRKRLEGGDYAGLGRQRTGTDTTAARREAPSVTDSLTADFLSRRGAAG
jgi:hypothetical protein